MNQHIKAAVTVKFQLFRPSDEELSNEMEFTYKPMEENFGKHAFKTFVLLLYFHSIAA